MPETRHHEYLRVSLVVSVQGRIHRPGTVAVFLKLRWKYLTNSLQILVHYCKTKEKEQKNCLETLSQQFFLLDRN